MTTPAEIQFKEVDLDVVAAASGKVVVFVGPDGKLDAGARKVNTLSRKTLARFVDAPAFEKMAPGDVASLGFPSGMAATAICVVKLTRRPSSQEARKAGAQLAKVQDGKNLLVLGGTIARADEIALGLALRGYKFDAHKSAETPAKGRIDFMVSKPEEVAKSAAPMAAIAEGVFFTRDLTNEPANVLTTDDFAARLAAMQ